MPLKVKNVEQGYVDSRGVFHPIRASSDYDEGRVYKPKPKAKKRAKKRAVKKAVKKTATRRKTVKAPARKATGGLRAYALAASRAKGGRRGVAMSRNGRSYVQKGVPPPRGWTPYPGAVVYISGVKTRLGKPTHGEGQTMYPLRPPVHGTTDMGARNLMQVVRVPEGETVRPGGAYDQKRNPIPATWTKAKVMRTRSGDVKVMLTR